jgi:Rha family phage regulatory protein
MTNKANSVAALNFEPSGQAVAHAVIAAKCATTLVTLVNGKPITDTLVVAKHFGREHKNVIQALERLLLQVDDRQFNALNFQPVDYWDPKGEKRKKWVMTEDGFAALAMGFTGAKAANLRVAFVKAFRTAVNELQKVERNKLDPNWLLERQRTKDHMAVLNDILVTSRARDGKQTAAHHFVNEARLIAFALTGSATAELDRSAMSAGELKVLDKVVRVCAGYIVAGEVFDVRKANARALAMNLLNAIPPSLQAVNGITTVEMAMFRRGANV